MMAFNNTITTSALLLIFRLLLAYSFLLAGYLKLVNWPATLYLFEYEYQVPFISWQLAAYIGTAAELILPAALLLGITTRLAALGLFVFNAVAVYSYPAIWEQGFWDHRYWGVMCLTLVVYGGGWLSVDRWYQSVKQSGSNS